VAYQQARFLPVVPQPQDQRRKPYFQFTVRCLLVATGLLAAVIGIARWMYLASREQRCREDLEFVSEGLMWYYRDRGQLPPAYLADSRGRRMHSWRSVLIPYLDCADRREISACGRKYKFDEPWDSRANTRLWNETAYYCFYSCSVCAKGSRNASYLCVVGGALWPPPKGDECWDHPQPRSLVRAGGALPKHGKAILLVEVVESHIPWTKPEDIGLSEIASLLGDDSSGSRFVREIRHVVAVDTNRSLYILDPARDLDEIRAIVDAEDGSHKGQASGKHVSDRRE